MHFWRTTGGEGLPTRHLPGRLRLVVWALFLAAICCVFLPIRALALIGLLLLAFLVPWLLLSGFCPALPGWEMSYHGQWPVARFLTPHPSGAICIETDLIKGPVSIEGTLVLSEGAFPASRLRSLPSGILLSGAVCATADLAPDPQALSVILPEMGLNADQFRVHFPVVDTIRFKGQEGRLIRDGKELRAYFLVTGLSEGDLLRFLAETRQILDQGKPRRLTRRDMDMLLELSEQTLLYFTARVQDRQLKELTVLGGLFLRKVQAYQEDVCKDIEALSAQGREVFTQWPLTGDDGALLPPSPVPRHAADDCLMLRKTGKEAAGLLEAANTEKAFSRFCLFLYGFSVLLLASVALYVHLSGLPHPAGLVLLALPFAYLFFSGSRRAMTIPAHPVRLLAVLLALVLANLGVALIVIGASWPPALLHSLSLGCILAVCLPCLTGELTLRSGRIFRIAALAFLILALLGWITAGLSGLFLILLNLLFYLALILIFESKDT